MVLLVGVVATMTSLLVAEEEKIVNRKPTKPDVSLPVLRDGSLVREFQSGEHRVVLDLSKQVLGVNMQPDESWREPNNLQEGDTVRTKSAVSLRVKSNTVAELPKGRVLLITSRKENFLETTVLERGKPVRGWVTIDSVEFINDRSPLRPTLEETLSNHFVPASVLIQKAKQFDDGLYAAIDLAAEKGAGKFAGKVKLLNELAHEMLQGDGKIDQPEFVILAACLLGKVPADLKPSVAQQVQAFVAEFQKDEVRSKPIGFYTWSDSLKEIFQQDRMLQSQLESAAGIERLVKLLHADKDRRASYEAYLRLVSRLTNPLAKPDLRGALATLDGGSFVAPKNGVYFFPPSMSQETELMKRMFPNGIVPPSFNLAETLVAKVQNGQLDLRPRPDSGWYDHQVYSLEPLAIPDKMPEARHLNLNDEYKKHLVELFKGVWALTRETHIKQLEIMATSAAPGRNVEISKPVIEIYPELHSEPLATSYLRRAASYRFVRNVIEESFGAETIRQMRRQTAAGPVAVSLADELRQMEGLFYGAYVAVNAELGLKVEPRADVGSGQGAAADAQTFLEWGANISHDPDLGRDARMMVPVYFDVLTGQIKVWVFLGWSDKQVAVGFNKRPEAKIFDAAGAPVDLKKVELRFPTIYRNVATPIVREIFVERLLNRDEFRKLCDTYKTEAAILGNLIAPAKK